MNTQDDPNRCAICGWPLVENGQMGCWRGNCSQRPLPERFYAPDRARAEYSPHLDHDPRATSPGALGDRLGPLNPAATPEAEFERRRILNNARRLRAEIGQIFIDCAHWNENVRKPDEEPIAPDPDGQLRRIADGLDRMLSREARRS